MKYSFFLYRQCEGEQNPVELQRTANAIALMARSLSFDSEFMSPFSVNARRNNINATGEMSTLITYIYDYISNLLSYGYGT